jgi:hypothetical protein
VDAREIPNIPALLDAEAAKRIKIFPHPNNRASEAGHPCIRFLVLSRISNNLRSLHDIGLQRIFDEGNLHEDALMRDMSAADLRIVEQQRGYEWPELQLTGRIDGKLSVNGSFVPLEIKSCSANIFPEIKEIEALDMLKSKHSWIRKYPAQILLYMLMEGSEFGCMLFKNKGNGEKAQKLFRLEGEALEYADAVIEKLKTVNAHVALKTVPEAVLIDDCRGCPFAKTACFPGEDYGPGIDILKDPELETKLERRAELEPAAKEFDAIDKEIKDGDGKNVKGLRGRNVVVGHFIIESKPYEMTSYDVPKELRTQYAIKKQAFRMTIERIV